MRPRGRQLQHYVICHGARDGDAQPHQLHDLPLRNVWRVVCRCGDCAAKRNALIIVAMSENGASESDNSPRQLSFGRFVVDLDRGCLLSDGREIPLRPHTFAILTYLAERPGELLAREELCEAGCPDLTGADDALDQTVAELRRAPADPEGQLIPADATDGYR